MSGNHNTILGKANFMPEHATEFCDIEKQSKQIFICSMFLDFASFPFPSGCLHLFFARAPEGRTAGAEDIRLAIRAVP